MKWNINKSLVFLTETPSQGSEGPGRKVAFSFFFFSLVQIPISDCNFSTNMVQEANNVLFGEGNKMTYE